MAGEIELLAPTAADTREIAALIAELLQPGDVVALTGELGAGKTVFVQGAAAALGVAERVTSPTFLLRRDYDGRVPLLHLDVYRLQDLQEVAELGYDEMLEGEFVTFVEWADAMAPLLPADHLEVELALAEPPTADEVWDAQPRRIVVRPRGHDWARRLPRLSGGLAPWARDTGEER